MKRTSAVDVKIQAVSPLSTDANAREGAHNAPIKAAAPRAKLYIKKTPFLAEVKCSGLV